MPNTFDIETLIARDLDNDLNKEEQATLRTWLDADASNRRYYDELKKTWELTGTADVNFDTNIDRNWERFQQLTTSQALPEQPRTVMMRFRSAIRIAATLLVLAGAGTLYFLLQGSGEVTMTTGDKEKKEISLPDGSKVVMNQHSSLRYARNLTGSERAVYLEGEAYFDVAHQEARPFVVYANHTKTQVLGTSFDIRAYTAQPVIVAVLTGKVAVSQHTASHADKLILTPGRKGIFSDDKQTEEIAIADPNYMAWKENSFRFDNVQLRDVIRTLENYYNVQIVIEDSAVARLDYRGDFSNAPALEDVLNVIAAAAEVSWSKEQGHYLLTKKN